MQRRKPLGRGKPLVRKAPLKGQRAPLSGSGGLKRGNGPARKPRAQIDPYEAACKAAFVEATLFEQRGSRRVRRRCALCGQPATDPHHVIEKEYLGRQGFPPEVV